jgi:copper chaperone CopZ
MSVNGVASVEVSLDKGLAVVKLKPANTVTFKQLQEAITKNGFTMKASKVVAAGKVMESGNGLKFQVSGSNEVLSLLADSASTPAPTPSNMTTIVEGTIPESTKGKTPDSIRYKSLTVEK